MTSNAVQCCEANRRLSLVGSSLEERQKLYQDSIEHNDRYWSSVAKRNYYWKETWADNDNVKTFNFHKSKGPIHVEWFTGGVTNVCYNALDRHLDEHGDRVCFFYEGNEPGNTETISYSEMAEDVIECANVLRSQYSVKKGDVVAVYLPMIPFAVTVMLACARIGAVVSVIFGGFSAAALATRLEDVQPCVLITADGSSRGKKGVPLKSVADEALKLAKMPNLRCLVCHNASKITCPMRTGRDTWFANAVAQLTEVQHKVCEIEWMAAEDPLFLLYTSGSTGKPKAIVHTTAGYMVYAGETFRYTFDYHHQDVYMCTADIGWITGHSYVVYGPMLNCATSVLFEGVPTYPTVSRWWELVEKYKVSIFYTAPTAIRSLMKSGTGPVKKCDLSSLRILGSVGEPINVEAWKWFRDVVGGGHADIVDTWWQTETGGHMITPLPGCTPQKPGCATLPFFGVDPVLLDPMTLAVRDGEADGLLAIRTPWPGIARTLYRDHDRYEKTYFSADGYYITGDGARRDKDGYIWITGRVDDVLNVSGHRIGTSEVENAANTHPAIVESAVVGVPHDIKGESIYLYIVPREGVTVTPQLLAEVRAKVREMIGPIASPDVIQPAPKGLPKTRSGKIVRRVLRKIATRKDDDLGDSSTLADPGVIAVLIAARREYVEKTSKI